MVRVVHRLSLFAARCAETEAPEGLTIAEIVERVQPDAVMRDYAVAAVNGHEIPRGHWARVRPKPGALIGIGYAPRGRSNENAQAGGGVSAGLMIAGSIVGLFLPPVGIALVAAGIAAGLATQFLLTPETADPYDGNDDPRRSVSVRNELGTDRPVPILLGSFRFAPPHAATPHSESIGGDDFYRALFSISVGLVTEPQIFIGETPIEQYADVETEFRRGWHASDVTDRGSWSMAGGAFPASAAFGDHYTISAAGSVAGRSFVAGETITHNGLAAASSLAGWDVDVFAPLRLYSQSVAVDPVGTEITSVTDWVDRRTAASADEAVIDLLWPRGLQHISKTSQKRAPLTVEFEYRIRRVGETAWTSGYFEETGAYGAEFTSSHRVILPARGQYDIGIRRITPDQTDAQNTDDVTWSILRSVVAEQPVPIGGISYLAMRIRRSGQLYGGLDQVQLLCQRIGPEWTGAAWVAGPISTPAAAFRAVLQSPIWRGAYTDEQMDLDRLADWADDSIARGYGYHAWIKDERTVADVLAGIARAGRARVAFRDGLASVAVDWEQPSAVMLLGPANSSGFSSAYAYPELPHGLRCSFNNSELNYQLDQSLIVYADGYSVANATNIEPFDALAGVVTAAQAARAARAELAERWLRRERHELSIGIGSLIVEVGDRVDVSHDAIAVGLAYGRVAAVTTIEETGLVSVVQLNTEIAGDDVALMIVVDRAGTVASAACVRTAADTVTISAPSSGFAPAVGDIVTVGTLTSSVLACIVDSIDPGPDLSARLGLIAYAPEVYTWEQQLPAWDPQALTPKQLPSPQVQSVYSGARVLTAAAGGSILVPHVVITWSGYTQSGVSVLAFVRPTGTTQAWAAAEVVAATSTSITIGGVEEGLPYDVSLIAVADGYISSAPAIIGAHQVVGRADPPDDLSGATIVQIGGQVLLQWEPPADVDVIFGGWVEVRHSSDPAETAWGNTTRVGALVSGHLTYAYRPAQPGVYMLRVYDSGGRSSSAWALLLSDQATAVTYVSVGTLQEDPTFSGTKTGCEVADDALQLATGGFDAVADPDSVNWDTAGGISVTSATYLFAGSFDWETPRRVRLTAHVVFALVNSASLWDDRLEPIDEWADIDMVEGAPMIAQVWYRTTDDDPEGTPAWGDWQRVDAAEVYCRAVQAKLVIGTDISSYNLLVSELALIADEVG